MVCRKEQIYNWFKTLDGAKRIDFLNGLLHLCFPLELRFIGSCIEELARKDYNYLRDAEVKANTLQEVSTMQDISDKVTRSKMIVTLALLTSTNQECARLLYNTLKIDIINILQNTKYLDDIIADEYLLLLTMASNHPAFDFFMKQIMNEQLKRAESKLKNDKILKRDSFNDFCFYSQEAGAQTVTPVSDTNNNTKTDLNDVNVNKIVNSHQSQDISAIPKSVPNGCGGLDDHDDDGGGDTDIFDENENDLDSVPKCVKKLAVFVKSIHFEGVKNIRGTENYKFLIKIHWSDNKVNKISKTFLEIYEFHKQLIKNYSTELNGLLKEDELEFNENKKEDFIKELPIVTHYCSKIVNLPEKISHTDFVTEFFKNGEYEECEDTPSTTPVPSSSHSLESLTQAFASQTEMMAKKEDDKNKSQIAETVKQIEAMPVVVQSTEPVSISKTNDNQTKPVAQPSATSTQVPQLNDLDRIQSTTQIDKKPAFIKVQSEPLKKISNSSVSSPCPSPIPQSLSTINNTGSNSRSNSPATQQRMHLAKQQLPQGIHLQHSPLFANQLAAYLNTSVPPPPILHQMQQQQQQHQQHQQQMMQHHQSSDISLNLQKSSLITINQQKYRTISTNQNEDPLSRSIDAQIFVEPLSQSLNDRPRVNAMMNKNQQRSVVENSNSPKNLQLTGLQMPPPPPVPNATQKYYEQQPPPPPQTMHLPPPPFPLQYPMNAYSLPPMVAGYPQLQQLRFQPQIDPQQMLQQQMTRYTNGGATNDVSSAESNSPPTSQSPALTTTTTTSQQNQGQFNQANSNSRNKMDPILQSDEDRDQKNRKANAVKGPMLTKQNSIDKRNAQLPFHQIQQQQQQMQYAPQMTPQQQQQYMTAYGPPPPPQQFFYNDSRGAFANTPPPQQQQVPATTQQLNGPITQPIGINVNTTYQDRQNTETPPISAGHDVTQKTKQQQQQQQQLMFPFSPQSQTATALMKLKDSQLAKDQTAKPLLVKQQSSQPTTSTTVPVASQKMNSKGNLMHNESTQSLPDISNLILSQNSRATPSPNFIETKQQAQFLPGMPPTHTTPSHSPMPVMTNLYGIIQGTQPPSHGGAPQQQYIDNEALTAAILSGSVPLPQTQSGDGTNATTYIQYHPSIYLLNGNLMPMMNPNGPQLPPSQQQQQQHQQQQGQGMIQPPPGGFYTNQQIQQIQQGFLQHQQQQAANLNASNTTRSNNDYQNGMTNGKAQPQQQTIDPSQFFDMHTLSQLMAITTNSNFLNKNFLQQQQQQIAHHQQQQQQQQQQAQLQQHVQQQQQQIKMNNFPKKKSCSNCGSNQHSASECKESTLENLNQSNGYRLNFKPTTNGTNSSLNETTKTVAATTTTATMTTTTTTIQNNNNNNNSMIDMNKLKNNSSDVNLIKTAAVVTANVVTPSLTSTSTQIIDLTKQQHVILNQNEAKP